MNKTTITVQDWIDALESGKYGQTKGKLYNGHNYCCLGVLCRVGGATFRGDDRRVVFIEKNGFEYSSYDLLDGVTSTDLTSAVRRVRTEKEFSITPKNSGIEVAYVLAPNGRVRGPGAWGVSNLFVDLNDDYGASFKEIAQVARNILRPSAKLRVWTN